MYYFWRFCQGGAFGLSLILAEFAASDRHLWTTSQTDLSRVCLWCGGDFRLYGVCRLGMGRGILRIRWKMDIHRILESQQPAIPETLSLLSWL